MKKILAFLLVFTIFFTKNVQAEDTTLSVSPAVVEFLLSPNHKASQTFNFSLKNSSIVTPRIYKILPNGESGNVIIDSKPLDESSIPLIITSSIPLNKPIIQSGNNLAITLTLEAASVDTTQDIYLALALESGSEIQLENSSTSVSISSLILTTINPAGVMPVNLQIEDFPLPLFHDSTMPLNISPKITNQSNVMIRPSGIIEITNSRGNKISEIKLYPNLVLANSSRKLSSRTSDSQTSLPSDISIKFPSLSFGPHKILINITTQSGTKITNIEKIIWVAPIRQIGLALLIIVITIYLKKRSKNI